MNILQKPIQLSNLTKITALKPARYPDKLTLNLCIHEKKSNRPTKVVPLVVLSILVLLLFTQFGVIGRWKAADRAEQTARETQAQLSALKEYTKDYETLRLEYAQHFSSEGSDQPVLADRMDLLALVEKTLLTAGQVEYFTVEGNILSAKISGVSLDNTADILDALYDNPLVTDVSVYTADKKTDTAIASVLMTINLGEMEETEMEETP